MHDDDSEGLRALSAVQKVFPSAILAGGYLRDCWFGRSPKDIDIFFEYTENPTAALRHALGAANVDPMMGAMYREQGDVNSVWDLKGFAHPCQVIMLNEGLTAISRVKDHDFDFCQIWHDGWRLNCTVAFTHMNAQEVTLTHCESQSEFNRSMDRWDRLKQKYPDFKLVIPPRYRHYV